MKKWLFALSVSGLLSMGAISSPAAANDPYQQLKSQFEQLKLQVVAVSESPLPGLMQVFTNRGLFFASADGQYLIEGNIYDLHTMQSVKDQQMQPFIKQQVAELAGSAIEYKASNEKYVVTVFTDPTCGYCRKLHNEMADYNKAGITVRYLAFPRGGESSETFLQMQHIWCAKNQAEAMNAAKGGKSVNPAMCNNQVKQQYTTGVSFGINGTPAIVLPNGQLVPGYQPAQRLLEQLESL